MGESVGLYQKHDSLVAFYFVISLERRAATAKYAICATFAVLFALFAVTNLSFRLFLLQIVTSGLNTSTVVSIACDDFISSLTRAMLIICEL